MSPLAQYIASFANAKNNSVVVADTGMSPLHPGKVYTVAEMLAMFTADPDLVNEVKLAPATTTNIVKYKKEYNAMRRLLKQRRKDFLKSV